MVKLLLLLPAVILTLQGCASIFSENTEKIYVPLPEGSQFSFVDTSRITRAIAFTPGRDTLIAEVPNRRPLMFVRTVGQRRDTAFIEVGMKYEYVLLNLCWLPWGPMIDAANGAQYRLRSDVPEFDSPLPDDGDTVSVEILRVEDLGELTRYQYGQNRLALSARYDLWTPSGGGGVGFGGGLALGYRLYNPLAITLGWRSAEFEYTGNRIRITPELSSFALNARFYPAEFDARNDIGFYLAAGGAWNVVTDDEVRRLNGGGRIPGTDIDDGIFSVEYGFGVSMPGLVMELWRVNGLSPFAVRENETPVIDVSLNNLVISWGFFLEI